MADEIEVTDEIARRFKRLLEQVASGEVSIPPFTVDCKSMLKAIVSPSADELISIINTQIDCVAKAHFDYGHATAHATATIGDEEVVAGYAKKCVDARSALDDVLNEVRARLKEQESKSWPT